jgi:hypothetical protein
MAFGSIQAVHASIMWADHGLVPTVAFVQNLGNRTAWIESITIVPHISLLILAAGKSLVHIAISCAPLAHDFIPAILPEIRTTI